MELLTRSSSRLTLEEQRPLQGHANEQLAEVASVRSAPGRACYAAHPPYQVQHGAVRDLMVQPLNPLPSLLQGLLNPSAATVKAPRIAAKGWTAFTAFGLHTRDAVRGTNPGATSVEVEKVHSNLHQLGCSGDTCCRSVHSQEGHASATLAVAGKCCVGCRSHGV